MKAKSSAPSGCYPLYLVLINLFVVPIALAGLLTFPAGKIDSDMFVLALPLESGSIFFTIIAFVGGLSAATAMVIVEIGRAVDHGVERPDHAVRAAAARKTDQRPRKYRLDAAHSAATGDLRNPASRLCVLSSAGEAQLASIGLLSFAAIAQLAPAFFGGLLWRRATSAGAIAGMTAGFLVWAYTLLLPTLSDIGVVGERSSLHGPWGLSMLRPQHLLGLDLPPLVHGVTWSLLLNVLFYIGFSLRREPSPIERLQANTFVPSDFTPIAPSFRLWRSSVTVEELTTTVARYLGEERTHRRSKASQARNASALSQRTTPTSD